jgi:hypothetical protein
MRRQLPRVPRRSGRVTDTTGGVWHVTRAIRADERMVASNPQDRASATNCHTGPVADVDNQTEARHVRINR